MGQILSSSTVSANAYLTELGRKYLFQDANHPRIIELEDGTQIDRLKIEKPIKPIFGKNNNPITKWCMTNVAVDIDKNDNIQPMKTSKSRRRIDGFAAMLNAYTVYKDKQNDYKTMI